MVRPGRHFPLVAAVMAAALVLAAFAAAPPPARGAPASAEDWTSNSSYTIYYLGRDGPDGADHYRVTLGWGASFFAIAAETMPLEPVEQAVNILMDGFRATYPGRPTEDIKPDDSFDFYLPAGTLVCPEWRQTGNAREFRSLRGDNLTIYTNWLNPLLHRLERVEEPGRVEVMINQEADLEPYELAQTLYGRDDPSFEPDFLQVYRMKKTIESKTATVTIDLGRKHLDDFREMTEGGDSGGTTEDGMEIYRLRDDQLAQPIFRVDDAIGDSTDPASFPSLIRVYYYKNGVVRAYQRADETIFISGRQPRNEAWEKVYAEYGRTEPPPTRWETGQPEQDDAARELKELGIVVLRYQPREPPKGNIFTQFLDMLMAFMKRKQS